MIRNFRIPHVVQLIEEVFELVFDVDAHAFLVVQLAHGQLLGKRSARETIEKYFIL